MSDVHRCRSLCGACWTAVDWRYQEAASAAVASSVVVHQLVRCRRQRQVVDRCLQLDRGGRRQDPQQPRSVLVKHRQRRASASSAWHRPHRDPRRRAATVCQGPAAAETACPDSECQRRTCCRFQAPIQAADKKSSLVWFKFIKERDGPSAATFCRHKNRKTFKLSNC